MDKIEKINDILKLYQQINIAFFLCFSSDKRTKNTNLVNFVFLKNRFISSQDFFYIFLAHVVYLSVKGIVSGWNLYIVYEEPHP